MRQSKVKIKGTTHTSGRGLWTPEKRKVRIKAARLAHVDEYYGCGELRVYFCRSDWKIDRHGLIYTDPMFLRELKAILKKKGFTGLAGVDYSEQGMQGWEYVSLDVGKRFINSWNERGGA